MGNRKGERIGWICGWLGAFLWVVVLAVIFFVQGRAAEAAVGLAILVTFFRNRGDIAVDDASMMKG